MAEPVYDEEKDLNELSPVDLRELEYKHSTEEDEAEDQAVESGADSKSLPRKGMGRKLRQHSEEQYDKELGGAEQKLKDAWDDAKASNPKYQNQLGSGYKPGKQQDKNLWQSIKGRQKQLAIASAITGGIITCIVLLLSFLNVFKLDGLMSNISDQVK
jgi:hypothetical protein